MPKEANATMEKKIPLFIVTGSSGSGKTYVVHELRKLLPEFDVFDIDDIRECQVTDDAQIRNVWLRVARNIAESGRMTIICGTAMPWDIEQCKDYHYFKHIYYLNLHCDAETREKRLHERKWSDEMIRQYIDFANRLIEISDEAYDPPMPTIDTSSTDVTEVASQIKDWVYQYV